MLMQGRHQGGVGGLSPLFFEGSTNPFLAPPPPKGKEKKRRKEKKEGILILKGVLFNLIFETNRHCSEKKALFMKNIFLSTKRLIFTHGKHLSKNRLKRHFQRFSTKGSLYEKKGTFPVGNKKALIIMKNARITL